MKRSALASDAAGVVGKSQRAGRAVADAFLRHGHHAGLNGAVEGRRQAHVEAASNKSQAQRFGGHLGQFDADAAENALARLENDAAKLELLIEGPALGAEPVGVGAIDLRVVLEQAVA